MLLVDCLWHNTNIVIDIHDAIGTAMSMTVSMRVCSMHTAMPGKWAYMRLKLFTSSIYVKGAFVSIIKS